MSDSSPDSAQVGLSEAVRKTRQAWLFPLIVWAVTIGIAWIPGFEKLPHLFLLPIALLRVGVFFFGMFRVIVGWKWSRVHRGVIPHAIAGTVVCAPPIFLFLWALFMPMGG